MAAMAPESCCMNISVLSNLVYKFLSFYYSSVQMFLATLGSLDVANAMFHISDITKTMNHDLCSKIGMVFGR